MRNILLIILSCFIFISCSGPITKFEFSNRAELRRFKVETTVNKTQSGYLFFFIGGYSSNETVNSKIKFYTKNKLNEYCLFEFELSNVKIKVDSLVNNAFVEFKLDESFKNRRTSTTLINDSLDYDTMIHLINYTSYIKAVITCNPKDFPENINLDQL